MIGRTAKGPPVATVNEKTRFQGGAQRKRQEVTMVREHEKKFSI